MDQIMEIMVATALYTLIAVRVGIIMRRIEPKGAAPYLFGILWPCPMIVVGFGTLITGSAGIYDSANRRH